MGRTVQAIKEINDGTNRRNSTRQNRNRGRLQARSSTHRNGHQRDGVEISRSYHRHVVAPDADITGESAEVQAICTAVHTQAVKGAYAAHIAAQELPE